MSVNLRRRLACLFGLHQYRLIAHVTPSSDHIGCPGCGRQWGMNHDVRALVPWGDVSGFFAKEYGYRADQYFSLRGPNQP